MLRLARTSRFLGAAAVAVLLATISAGSAAACTDAGYGYAGLIGADTTRGVRATLSAVSEPTVHAGHVAAWVGVGGRGFGPNGEDEWIQVGLAAFQGTSLRLYYEIMRGSTRDYIEVAVDIPARERHRVAVAEVVGSPGWWRAWADGRPVSPAVYLAGSHGAWQPVATAENWGAGSCTTNAFHLRFRDVAMRSGRKWRRLPVPFVLEDPGFRLVLRSPRIFDAIAGGGQAL